MENLVHTGLVVVVVYAVLWLCIGLPYRMAARRKRNPGHWVLISLFGTPVLAILLLLALDEQPAHEQPARKPDSPPE